MPVMRLGNIPKPRTPAEDVYMLSKTTAPPVGVNLNEEVSLLKYCPRILAQMDVGACAQFSVAEADFIMANATLDKAGRPMNTELAHAGFLYEVVRRRRGWFPSDTGSIVSDGFDYLLQDKPLASRCPYQNSAAFDYDDSLFVNAKPIDEVLSHRPFFVEEGNALEQIKACLDKGWPVVVSMYWHPSYFDPPNGILPEGVAWNPSFGGHAMTIRGRTPDRGGLSAVINHWTENWNGIVTRLGFDFRPGEVAIPDSFFLPGKNSPVFELRCASPEPVAPLPQPEPPPKPEPQPQPTITKQQVIGMADSVISGYQRAFSAATTKHYRNKAKWNLEGAKAVRDKQEREL